MFSENWRVGASRLLNAAFYQIRLLPNTHSCQSKQQRPESHWAKSYFRFKVVSQESSTLTCSGRMQKLKTLQSKQNSMERLVQVTLRRQRLDHSRFCKMKAWRHVQASGTKTDRAKKHLWNLEILSDKKTFQSALWKTAGQTAAERSDGSETPKPAQDLCTITETESF